MKFRYKAEDFADWPFSNERRECLAIHCNHLLEAEELKCEKVCWSEDGPSPTHSALIWNIEKIEEGEK